MAQAVIVAACAAQAGPTTDSASRWRRGPPSSAETDTGTAPSVPDPRPRAVYRCRAAGHCQWPAGRVDAHVESVIVERLSKPDVTDLLPRETQMDVVALREELIVTEARKKGAAQMYARGTIDAEQLETITAETDQATGKIRAELSAATAKSPLADFAATDDARRCHISVDCCRPGSSSRCRLPVPGGLGAGGVARAGCGMVRYLPGAMPYSRLNALAKAYSEV